jgi:membrane-associated phospholipid phosphatase
MSFSKSSQPVEETPTINPKYTAPALNGPCATRGNEMPDPDLGKRPSLMRLASRPAWTVLAFTVLGITLGCYLTGTRFELWTEFFFFASFSAIIIMLAAVLHGRGITRLALLIESFVLTSFASVFFALLCVVVAMTALPLRDEGLMAVDAALGFDWSAAALFFKETPWLSRLMSTVYLSLQQQVPSLLVALVVVRPDLLRQFTATWCCVLLSTVLIFPFIPALGGYLHFALPQSDFPDIIPRIAWEQGKVLIPARAGTIQALDASVFSGIVQFPSFHAGGAVILMYFWWQIPVVRYPAAVLNLLMILSAIPCGGHYLVDLAAGVALAVVIIWALQHYFLAVDERDFEHAALEDYRTIWRRHVGTRLGAFGRYADLAHILGRTFPNAHRWFASQMALFTAAITAAKARWWAVEPHNRLPPRL